jgi:hypothetical protein
MKRMLLMIGLFAAVSVTGSALAQGPGGFGKKKGPPAASAFDRLERIEGELAQIHRQLNKIEAILRQSRGSESKGFGPGPWGFAKKAFDKKGFGWAKGFEKKGFGPPGFDKKGFGWAKGFEKKGFGPPGFDKKDGWKGFEKKAFDNKPFEKKRDFSPPASGRTGPSIQEQLDQIQREIGELRRVLKKK